MVIITSLLTFFILFILALLIYFWIDNSFILYTQVVYTGSTFNKIKQICTNVPNSKLEQDEASPGRLYYAFLDTKHPIYGLIYNKTFLKGLQTALNNPNLVPCLSIPIEYRIYRKGAYMDWHSDVQMLPDQNQYECVLTLTNTSDSLTLFRNSQQIKSEPNSLIIVRANGIQHAVTKTTSGERTIIKFALMTAPLGTSKIEI